MGKGKRVKQNKVHNLPSQSGNAALKQEQHELRYHEEYHSGPLPPPEQIEKYNQVIPGFAEKLFEDVRARQAHIMDIEKQKMEIEYLQKENERKLKLRGQWFAFYIVLIAVLSSCVLAYLEAYTSALIVTGTTLTTIVAAFLYNRESQ